jgi:hypothetical protein
MGFDVPHKISCNVRNFPLVVVFNWTLSNYLGLGYCDFCKVSRNVVDVISKLSCHADIWISFFHVLIGSDRPTGVSQSRLTSALLSVTFS